MDGFVGPMVTGVAIVMVAFGVVLVAKSKIKKGMEDSNKPPEVKEAEMQELIAKAKADMEKRGKEDGGGE